tara:strand:- start:124 stop:738 length:615 start_codon:yes stop_codon:yes gene_type:complete
VKRLAVFASGRGSNFRAIWSEISAGNIPAEVCLFITDNPQAKSLEFARSVDISSFALDTKMPGFAEQILRLLEDHNIDLVVLAGYMKLIPADVVDCYENRIINIHPALLPAFGGKGCYGLNVHKKVINSGVKKTGVTVHYVNRNYDEGHIIAQETVNVFPEDTAQSLAEKVLKIEHELFPDILKEICNNRMNWINGKPWVNQRN